MCLQNFHSLATYLSQCTSTAFLDIVSDFHLLLFLVTNEVMPLRVRKQASSLVFHLCCWKWVRIWPHSFPIWKWLLVWGCFHSDDLFMQIFRLWLMAHHDLLDQICKSSIKSRLTKQHAGGVCCLFCFSVSRICHCLVDRSEFVFVFAGQHRVATRCSEDFEWGSGTDLEEVRAVGHHRAAVQ